MRISTEYYFLNKFIEKYPTLSSRYQMSIRLMKSVESYFEKLLLVNSFGKLLFQGGDCFGNVVPVFSLETDLYITIMPELNTNDGYFAAAATCYVSKFDGRPVIGVYILNFAYLRMTVSSEYLYYGVYAHEFTHILGFSSNLYEQYVDSSQAKKPLTAVVGTVKIGDTTFNSIKMPEVVEWAKSHFGCNSLEGVPIENGGGDGSADSHWEKTYLPFEYMNPSQEFESSISELTIAFLRGTGWYRVNDGSGVTVQSYDWGKSAGCSFFEVCPSSTNHGYCDSGLNSKARCSSEWTAKVPAVDSREYARGSRRSLTTAILSTLQRTPA